MKKGLYFLKDKKCHVYKVDDTPHGVGEPDVLTDLGSLWCYAKQLNQNLVAESGVIYANNETRLFVFNYNDQIEQGCFIEYRDQWFKATRVDTTDDYQGEMFVYVQDSTDPTSSSSGSSGSSGGSWWGEVGS